MAGTELYGVQSGGDYYDGFIRGYFEVEPARALIDRIQQLPLGAKVAIEATAAMLDEEPLKTSYGEISYARESIRYWQKLADMAKARGHEIVYLDDDDLQRRAAEAQLEANQHTDYRLPPFVDNPDRLRDVHEKAFAFGVQASYLSGVVREELIFTKLAVEKPALAVIGLGHSEYLMQTLAQYPDIVISEYWQGHVPDDIAREVLPAEATSWPVPQVMVQREVDPSFVDAREQLERSHRAATLGRIVVRDEVPQWIGSWRPSCRPYGLFEVYPVAYYGSGGAVGIIEDRLGMAMFNGQFEDHAISFTKNYSRPLDDNVIEGPINYQAEVVDMEAGEYEGEWNAPGEGGGTFIIKRGDHLFDPIDISNPQPELDIPF